MQYKVSVVLTTYNCCDFISSSIKSVLNQTHPDFELIIIDDGSEDETHKVVNQFYDPRIRYVKIEHVGYSASLNFGLELCKYEWIAFQDSDDIWLPNKLENQVKLIETSDNFIVCKAAYFSEDKIKYIINIPQSKDDLKKIWALHGHIATSGLLVNKHVLSNAGGFDVSLNIAADYDFFLKSMNFIQVGLVNEIGVLVRIRKNSLSRSNIKERNRIIYNIQKKYYQNIYSNFQIIQFGDQLLLLGWREWFYGDKSKARNYWIKKPALLLKPKVVVGFLLSFLPLKHLVLIQNLNLKYRIKYIFNNLKLKRKLRDFILLYV